MSKQLQFTFMRVVVNALSIIILHQLGYDTNRSYATWKSYQDDFLLVLNKQEMEEDE